MNRGRWRSDDRNESGQYSTWLFFFILICSFFQLFLDFSLCFSSFFSLSFFLYFYLFSSSSLFWSFVFIFSLTCLEGVVGEVMTGVNRVSTPPGSLFFFSTFFGFSSSYSFFSSFVVVYDFFSNFFERSGWRSDDRSESSQHYTFTSKIIRWTFN